MDCDFSQRSAGAGGRGVAGECAACMTKNRSECGIEGCSLLHNRNIPFSLLNMPVDNQDEQLRQLIKDVLHYPTGSRERDRAVGSLVKLIPHLPSVSKRQYPRIDYQEALFRAYEGVCQNLGRFLQGVNLDIETADAQAVREAFVRRFNRILNNKVADLYREVGDYISLDAPINREEGGATFAENLSAPTLSGLDNIIKQERKEEVQLVDGKLRVYIETDPEGRLRNCHPRPYPQFNCQELAKRRLLKDPPDGWRELTEQLKVPYGNVTHWQRRCLPLLQRIAEELGYQPE
ncbi:MAG: hypothetical protein KME26_00435 [Oscillatoria princeps RMCB-10]|jgi:phage baseplate assembly protein W|nr:hypothetical protein [Oscillatoria princeps RMCB-10]